VVGKLFCKVDRVKKFGREIVREATTSDFSFSFLIFFDFKTANGEIDYIAKDMSHAQS